jgi:hypothetical protein
MFREALRRRMLANALFQHFDAALREAGHLAMSVDAGDDYAAPTVNMYHSWMSVSMYFDIGALQNYWLIVEYSNLSSTSSADY